MTRQLAEVVAEGRRLRIKPGQKVFNERQTVFLYDHGPSLLAVAESALDLRADFAGRIEECGCRAGSVKSIAAFDALAAPAPEGDGR